MSYHVYGKGLRAHPDDRDVMFSSAVLMPITSQDKLVDEIFYKTGPRLNQGHTNSCTGHAGKGWLMAEPVMSAYTTSPSEWDLYGEARKLDIWEDNDCGGPECDVGSSSRAVAKAMVKRQLMDYYVWLRNAQQVADWMRAGRGGVMLGIPWMNSMHYPIFRRGEFKTRKPHTIGILPVIDDARPSGHAVYTDAYSEELEAVRLVNSWGEKWSIQGKAWLKLVDLDKMLTRMGGEALTGVQKRQLRRPAPVKTASGVWTLPQ
jgi:hypothetical protein